MFLLDSVILKKIRLDTYILYFIILVLLGFDIWQIKTADGGILKNGCHRPQAIETTSIVSTRG